LPDLASTAQAEASPTTTTSAAAMPAAAAHTPGAPTRLSIPALGLDAPIVEVPLQDGTWDMQALTFEIAHLGHTAYPGQGSNVVLAGHVTIVGGIGPFYRLEQLSDGAAITVYAGEQAFVYTVASRERCCPPT
jgi:LPXTG-site transpeptidase (sortase) family protein